MDNNIQTYVNKNGSWVPMDDHDALHNHPVMQEQVDEEEEGISGFDHLDEVLEEMNDASLEGHDFTADWEDAGMLYDYIVELRERVAEQESQIKELTADIHKMELRQQQMFVAPSVKEMPLLRAIAESATEFIYWFGGGEVFCDDAIVEYEILRDRVRHYNEKKQA